MKNQSIDFWVEGIAVTAISTREFYEDVKTRVFPLRDRSRQLQVSYLRLCLLRNRDARKECDRASELSGYNASALYYLAAEYCLDHYTEEMTSL